MLPVPSGDDDETKTAVVEDIETYAQDIVDTVREPLLMLDTSLRVQSANRAFYQTFKVSSEETENRLIYELGNGQWDIPALRTLLEDVIPTSSVFNDFELEHTFPVIGRRVMLLNGRKLRAGSHGELLVLAMEDVTARKRAEEALLKAGALQSAIFNSANFSSIATDEKGRHSNLQRRRGADARLYGRRSDEQDYPGRHFRSAGGHRARQGVERRTWDEDRAGI